MSSPWEILGVERGADTLEIRKAFRSKALRLHPDKGGSAREFRELYDAYNLLNDTTIKKNNDDDDDDEWFGWLSRWAKRFLSSDERVLKIKVPYKLLKDRSQTICIEYDGIPVQVSLQKTEAVVFSGLRVRLIPHVFIMMNDEEVSLKEDPWIRDNSWLFEVPEETEKFKVKGGEWTTTPGEYCSGVFWRK